MSLVLYFTFWFSTLFIFGCYGWYGVFLGPTMCLVVMPLADSLIGERFNHLLNPKPKKSPRLYFADAFFFCKYFLTFISFCPQIPTECI